MAKEPILILIASGADPSQELRELGEAAVGIQRYFEVNMNIMKRCILAEP